MKNNIRFISGKEYTLSQIFSGTQNRIVIPDLQRDYCWGDKAYKGHKKDGYTELVSGFVRNLLEVYNEKSEENLTLGLIYGYENPKYHINLSDGQQRITTLFLLIGILNKKNKNNNFQKYLISDYEINQDDKEPYLQYAIRESTLYFLNDLVSEFFLKDIIQKVEYIKNQDWYFKEYDLDPSIQSMIKAMQTIENLLSNNVDSKKFGDFILNKLQLIYYDMGNRVRGEETFVVINTTGEPLTATENLKPILIGNIQDDDLRRKASEEWEEREEWFWQNIKRDKEKTSDQAFYDFFIWYWNIRLQRVSFYKNGSYLNPRNLFTRKPDVDDNFETKWKESIKTDTIHRYFKALKKLIDEAKDDKISKVLNTIRIGEISLDWFRNVDLDVVLPLIAYMEKFKVPTIFYEFVRRVRKNFYDKKFEDRKENFVDWRYIIQIIELSENEKDVFVVRKQSLKGIKKVKLNEWYNEEEQIKDKITKDHKELIEEWEDYEDFMGDLTPLFKISDSLDIKVLKSYYETYKNIRIKNYCFSSNTYLQNIYRLVVYLENGRFEHRSVAGHGYCMLVESRKNDFLNNGFVEAWNIFTNEDEKKIIRYFHEKLINIINTNILNIDNHFNCLDDIGILGHYEIVKLWAVLEFLNKRNEILDYSNSIACFWDKSLNLKYKNEIENLNYKIGNLLLGTSYFNNKTGWLKYDKYPLMRSIKSMEIIDIDEQTKYYRELILNFINK